MEYEKLISNAFSYARHSKATLALTGFFVGTAAVVLILAALLLAGSGLSSNPSSWSRSLLALGPMLLIFIVGVLVLAFGGLALMGTIIRNSTRNERLSESWRAFSPRYWTLVGVIAVTIVVSFIVSIFFTILGAISPILFLLFYTVQIAISLALGFFLTFAEYAAVLDSTGMFDSLRRSIALSKQKPVDVFLALLVCAVVAFLLLLVVVGIALVLAALVIALSYAAGAGFSAPVLVVLGIVGLVALVGVFFTQVFQFHFLAHAYLDLTRQAPVPAPQTQNRPPVHPAPKAPTPVKARILPSRPTAKPISKPAPAAGKGRLTR